MRKYQSLTERIDCLTEAGNIGAGHAATALSTLLNKPIDMTIAKVTIRGIHELGDILGSEENYIVAMLIEVYGDMKAMLMLALEVESAQHLINHFKTQASGEINVFDEMDASILCETGNILAGSYINALGMLTQLHLTLSVPDLAMDMAVAILSYPAIVFSEEDNAMMFIETKFTDTEKLLNGTYVLILNQKGFDTIVQALE